MTIQKIMPALALAFVMIATALGVTLLKRSGDIDGDAAIRIIMVMNGLMLAYYANAAPKAVFRNERARAVQRLTGWAFVMASVGYAAVWAFAPIETANIASMGLLGAGFLIVLSCCVWTSGKTPPAQ